MNKCNGVRQCHVTWHRGAVCHCLDWYFIQAAFTSIHSISPTFGAYRFLFLISPILTSSHLSSLSSSYFPLCPYLLPFLLLPSLHPDLTLPMPPPLSSPPHPTCYLPPPCFSFFLHLLPFLPSFSPPPPFSLLAFKSFPSFFPPYFPAYCYYMNRSHTSFPLNKWSSVRGA